MKCGLLGHQGRSRGVVRVVAGVGGVVRKVAWYRRLMGKVRRHVEVVRQGRGSLSSLAGGSTS